jgi:hypothetical protein
LLSMEYSTKLYIQVFKSLNDLMTFCVAVWHTTDCSQTLEECSKLLFKEKDSRELDYSWIQHFASGRTLKPDLCTVLMVFCFFFFFLLVFELRATPPALFL